MGVDEGDLQVDYSIDVDVILENCPITIVIRNLVPGINSVQRARGGECRGTQGFCWGRRDLWRRGTRAKKRLASYAR